MENKHPIRVCYFGTYRDTYSRNQMMIAGLRLNGISVVECHETLWHGIDDRVQTVAGGWKSSKFWLRIFQTYWRLLKKFFKIKDYDVLVVGYPGQLDIFLARILSWIKRKPLVWDVFMSIYLISVERGLQSIDRSGVKLLFLLEKIALKLPNRLILDTIEYQKWFVETYNINPQRIRLVPTGADDRIFKPFMYQKGERSSFIILYSGTFIPNHGIRYILEAAKEIRSIQAIEFQLIGEGPELESAQKYVQQEDLHNVKFFSWMSKDDLIKKISNADICLGAFGTTPQSMMTVQNKIYETMAMGRPLISGDSPAIRHAYTHGEHIYLCKRADGKALAEAIITLWNNPLMREKIARNGYQLYMEKYCLLENGKRFEMHLRELIA